MLRTEENGAHAYAEATDGCRRSLLGTLDNARQRKRVKPDEESHVLAKVDYEKEPMLVDNMPQATPLRASTCAR